MESVFLWSPVPYMESVLKNKNTCPVIGFLFRIHTSSVRIDHVRVFFTGADGVA